jgi:hypothetical protein
MRLGLSAWLKKLSLLGLVAKKTKPSPKPKPKKLETPNDQAENFITDGPSEPTQESKMTFNHLFLELIRLRAYFSYSLKSFLIIVLDFGVYF